MRPFGFLHRRRYWTLLVCFYAANATAEPPESAGTSLVNTDLQVQRDAEAQDCPDADQLAAELSAHEGPHTGPPVPQHVHVNFSRSAGEYRAELTMSGWRSGRRVFSTPDPRCTGVARATVLAISILLDPSVEALEETSPVAPAPATSTVEPTRTDTSSADASAPARTSVDAPSVQSPAPVVLPQQPSPVPGQPATADAPQSRTLWLGAGTGVASDFSEWEALTFELALRWRLQKASIEVASFVTTPDAERDEVGESRVMLMGAHGRACLAAPKGATDVLALNLCGQLSAAAIRGWAQGYDDLEPVQYRPWLAIGPMAQIAGFVGSTFGWRVTLAVPVAITRESYVIEGPSGVYRQAFTTEPWSFWLGGLAELPIL